MRLAKSNCVKLPKSSLKALPNIDIFTDGPDDDVDEYQCENFEDSCRMPLAKKMPSNCYLSFNKANSHLQLYKQ
jgi:hypothetical protein